jgi:DUF2075 family protein
MTSCVRLLVGGDYIKYIADVFGQSPDLRRLTFGDYDLKFFENFSDMNNAIRAKDAEFGLARNIAGFGWKWKSKKKENKHLVDFQLDGLDLTWNRAEKDWISSPGSLDEVGSIHTVQGYDLNYAGVIVGPELVFDTDKYIYNQYGKSILQFGTDDFPRGVRSFSSRDSRDEREGRPRIGDKS